MPPKFKAYIYPDSESPTVKPYWKTIEAENITDAANVFNQFCSMYGYSYQYLQAVI